MIFYSPDLIERGRRLRGTGATGERADAEPTAGPQDGVEPPVAGVGPRRMYLDAAALVAVALGCVVSGYGVLGMAYARFQASFRLLGDHRPPTPEEIDAHESALTLSLVAAGVALVAGLTMRRTGPIAWSLATLVAVGIAAWACAVPGGRWDSPDPTPSPSPTYSRHHGVCYGTTGDCVGG